MLITPVIQGVVSRTAHPYGCEQAILKQIQYVKSASPIQNGPKRVLILGASSGFGLAARIALTFGGANADTIGVSMERGPSEKGVGSAGYYNNHFFQKYAQENGNTAVNITGDVFSEEVREQVIEAIETYFEGEVDLVIYSIASGMRRKGNSDEFWRSAIKPIGNAVSGSTIVLENDQWVDSTLEPASADEIESTVKVMGGEDWENWIDTLINADSVADGCKTVAFSYIGPEVTHPIYLDGTLGYAKVDLHQTSHSLNLKLANYNGGAYASVCKALVTKASVYIPGLSPYILALYKVMKEKGTHEGCIEQMQRLFSQKLYVENGQVTPVDNERLIRMDDRELDPDTQQKVSTLLSEMNADNFTKLGDYQGFKQEFLNLNGFGFNNIDYTQEVDLEPFFSER